MSTEILGRAASGAEARTLRIELIKTLYTQQPTVLIASILNAAIVTFVVWDVVPRPWPALWLALICAVALAQVALWRYRRQPEFEDSASLLVAAALAHGIVWGAAGVMFFTPGIVIYQVFLAFVIGGMCAGAAAALSTYMPAFYAFLVPSIAPLIVRLLIEGETVPFAMGLLLTLFCGAMLVLARNLNGAITGSIKLRLEKEALAAALAGRQVKLEREVVENAARLGAVVNDAPVVLWAIDKEGTVTLSEGKGLEALGQRSADRVGRSIFDIYRDNPQVVRNVRRVLAGEQFTDVLDLGGVVFTDSYYPLRDANGEIEGAMGVGIDVTAQWAAEESAQQHLQRLATILEAAGDGILSINERGIIGDANPAAGPCTAPPPNSFVGPRSPNCCRPRTAKMLHGCSPSTRRRATRRWQEEAHRNGWVRSGMDRPFRWKSSSNVCRWARSPDLSPSRAMSPSGTAPRKSSGRARRGSGRSSNRRR